MDTIKLPKVSLKEVRLPLVSVMRIRKDDEFIPEYGYYLLEDGNRYSTTNNELYQVITNK